MSLCLCASVSLCFKSTSFEFLVLKHEGTKTRGHEEEYLISGKLFKVFKKDFIFPGSDIIY